jgi:hypothetical protein
MEIRNSQTNKLVERSYSRSIQEPYFTKKAPVMMLLAKILYGVVIFVLIGFGVYFLYMSKQDDLSQDVIDFNKKSAEWNQSARSEFEDWEITIKNEKNLTIYLENEVKKMHQYEDNENIYYNPLQKISKNLAPLISNIKLTKKKSDASVNIIYNLKYIVL